MKRLPILILLTFLISCGKHEPIHIEDRTETASFSFHAEVETNLSMEHSSISVCLTSGQTVKPYKVEITIDGELYDRLSRNVYFASTPIYKENLPEVFPGRHVAIITLSIDECRVADTLSFTEPVRHKELNMEIRNDESGYTYFILESNPYNLSVSVTDSLIVEGSCTYTYCTSPSFTRTETKHKTLTDVRNLYNITPKEGEKVKLIDWGAKEEEMESFGEMNYGWKEVWKTDSEGYWDYYEVALDLSHYRVISSKQYITASFEPLSGITVNVRTDVPGCFFNGVDLSKGTYSYPL